MNAYSILIDCQKMKLMIIGDSSIMDCGNSFQNIMEPKFMIWKEVDLM